MPRRNRHSANYHRITVRIYGLLFYQRLSWNFHCVILLGVAVNNACDCSTWSLICLGARLAINQYHFIAIQLIIISLSLTAVIQLIVISLSLTTITQLIVINHCHTTSTARLQ